MTKERAQPRAVTKDRAQTRAVAKERAQNRAVTKERAQKIKLSGLLEPNILSTFSLKILRI